MGKLKTEYKYNVMDVIKNGNLGKIQILEQIRMTNGKYKQKGYRYRCLLCGNEDNLSENNISKNVGCNVCGKISRKILKGYNDLWTTNPDIAKLLKNKERGYEISRGNDKKEWFVCSDCGYEKYSFVSNVVRHGLSCPKCGDGVSFPNKIGFNLLEQLSLKFETEYNPDWIKPKRFDFYFKLNDKKYILEMDGELGHGNKNKLNGQSAEESKEIDDYKDSLAKERDIEIIRINCEHSDLEYIRNNIIYSRLAEIINLSEVDWLKCYEFACNNLVKVVCGYWNNGIRSASLISKQIHIISRKTVTKYLKQGAELGWCDYDPKEALRNAGIVQGKKNGLRNNLA